MHVSTKDQLLLIVSKRKTLSQMVKKDRQDLSVWFNQAAYVLTSLRMELVRSRQAYFHSLSCMREVPLPSPYLVPESPLQAQVPSPVWGECGSDGEIPPSSPYSAVFDSGYE